MSARFDVPFFLFQGETDVITLTGPAEEYFAEIVAPIKKMVLVKDSGHFAASVVVLVLLAALHILSPGIYPSWQMVSEYAAGNYGWVLALLFVAWGLSTAALFYALWPHIRTAGGKIGLALLLVSAAGSTLASVFDFQHNLHGLAALLGIPTFPAAALLINASLGRSPGWSPARRSLQWTAHLSWISLVVMMAALFAGLAQTGGQFGPGVLIGWPNRLLVLAYCAWRMAAARQALRLEG